MVTSLLLSLRLLPRIHSHVAAVRIWHGASLSTSKSSFISDPGFGTLTAWALVARPSSPDVNSLSFCLLASRARPRCCNVDAQAEQVVSAPGSMAFCGKDQQSDQISPQGMFPRFKIRPAVNRERLVGNRLLTTTATTMGHGVLALLRCR